ncbi:hypothetical protein SAQ01S_06970 [Sphingomonas aquatilis NBRC 16722]|uniref:UrcA family protein n=1 Tax=Sphingomonas aquatilis TaxID=93063 RepID=A0AAW3TX96_9SPHN|nr:hypothetical protein [Sphingomonas aquatilis]MBB3876080.1 hypothetical protein [Sphingomonas aquatilis]GEM70931.1 hypothetical protein SAQ01S_06970 [Sphingomonas aquatilis NBRC 16722]
MATHTSTRRGILSAMAIAPIVIAAPAAAASSSQFETLRLEYLDVQARANRGYDDEHPVFLALCGRLGEIEHQMIHKPCASLADARAKMRFMMDLNDFGTVFDSDDSHAIVADMSRFML